MTCALDMSHRQRWNYEQCRDSYVNKAVNRNTPLREFTLHETRRDSLRPPKQVLVRDQERDVACGAVKEEAQ